jgi:hypothetical protein
MMRRLEKPRPGALKPGATKKPNRKKMKKKAIVLFGVLLACLSISGCAVKSLPLKPMDFSENSENGLLVGSVTFPSVTPNFDGYFFRLTNNTSQEFQISRNDFGQLDDGRTYLFVVERPAGTSEIPSVRLFHNSVMMAAQRDIRIGGFSIPYEIKKGQITYIGNIIFNDFADGGDTVVKLANDKFRRDIDELRKFQPSIDWSHVNHDDNRKIIRTGKKARL